MRCATHDDDGVNGASIVIGTIGPSRRGRGRKYNARGQLATRRGRLGCARRLSTGTTTESRRDERG